MANYQMNPFSILLGLILIISLMFFLKSLLFNLIVSTTLLLFLCFFHWSSCKKIFSILTFSCVVFFVHFIFIKLPFKNPVYSAFIVSSNFFIVLSLLLVFQLYVSPFDIYIEMKRFNFPHRAILAFILSYRFFEILKSKAFRVKDAYISRGASFKNPKHVIGFLVALVSITLDSAEDMALLLETRGY